MCMDFEVIRIGRRAFKVKILVLIMI